MNSMESNNIDSTIEVLTLKLKQILERSASSNENVAGTDTTVSSIEKLKNSNNFEQTPLSNSSINSVLPAASAFCPVDSDDHASETIRTNTDPCLQNVQNIDSKLDCGKTRCPYCDKECENAELRIHTDVCESRQIECEACGEKVMLDIFDFHLETCTAALYRQYNGDFFSNPAHNYDVHQEQEVEEDHQRSWADGVEPQAEDLYQNEEEEEEEGNGEPMSISDLTYEQLIALDNTIVKKGLTNEELQKCPIEVHLKELDEPVNCNVCLCEAESGEFVRKLTCGHKFHRDCVDTWLKNNITCPSCKVYLR